MRKRLDGEVRRPHLIGWLGGMLAGALLMMPAAALATELRQDAPARYTVVKGDTLWDISGRFLQSPWQWPEVWDVNPQIRNPHLIYPGDSIYLHYENGQPRLGLERGQGGVVRLSPEVRRIPHREAIPPLPLNTVENFLEGNRIVDPSIIEGCPMWWPAMIGESSAAPVTGSMSAETCLQCSASVSIGRGNAIKTPTPVSSLAWNSRLWEKHVSYASRATSPCWKWCPRGRKSVMPI
ncbi:LysM peptidoglycan-binding domain-containing protein [Modicisalibacter luteus]|uniref:LysM peptidoglycan-binding domain-containing protein n=1 Tax=Modicisalibacter luteus TaxID=453962 RepID=UPI003637A2E1